MKTLFISNNLLSNFIAKLFFQITKRIYLGPFSPIIVSRANISKLSGNREVLLKSVLCGICGTDIAKLSCNDHQNLAASVLRRKGEQYLGHEVVARVVEASEKSKFKRNDRVVLAEINNCKAFDILPECFFCIQGSPILCSKKNLRKRLGGNVYGGFSELFIRTEEQLLLVPDSISDESAALVEPAAVALHALIKSKIKPGERVFIYGAGLISLILIRLIKLYFANGVEVDILGRHQFQLDEAINAGATRVYLLEDINELATSLDTVVLRSSQISKASGQIYEYLNQGYSKVFDFVGSTSSLRYGLSIVESNGTIVAIGAHGAETKLDISFLISRELKIYGVHGYAFEMIFDEYQHCMISILELMEQGKLDLSKYLTHQYSIDSYKSAIIKATSHFRNQEKVTDPVFRVGIRFNQ
jgi:threonine dehydrogenase-like Zn-dependent dehydrogenase